MKMQVLLIGGFDMSKTLAVSLIQKKYRVSFINDMTTLIPVGDGRLSVAEVTIPEGAPAADKKLWEINLPGEVIVGCILRKDQTIIPRGDTRILAGDTLVLLSSAHQETAAIHELTGR